MGVPPPNLAYRRSVAWGYKLADMAKINAAKRVAHKEMLIEVSKKSPDHRNLVDVYKGCLMMHTGRYRIPGQRQHECMVDLSEWSEKLTLKVPFSVIRNDIQVGEANVSLEYR